MTLRRWIELAAIGAAVATGLAVGVLAPALLGRVLTALVLTLVGLEVVLIFALPETDGPEPPPDDG